MEQGDDTIDEERMTINTKSEPINSCEDSDKVCHMTNQDQSARNSKGDCLWRNPLSCLELMTASLPFIGINQTLMEHWIGRISQHVQKFIQFVIPRFPTLNDHHYYSLEIQQQLPKAIRDVWDSIANATQHHSPGSDFMLRHFDTNNDGTISSNELLNMTEFVHHMMAMVRSTGTPQQLQDMSWITWFRREWPLMDWKLGVFIWRSFGGILLVLAVLSIIPGRLHGISGKILRWPVLGMTYFLITVELVVYIVIRLFIRVAEHLIARPKHRKLRRQMALSKSYPEWYKYAAELDQSQKRDRWLKETDDGTSKRYNWVFIRELIKDMQRARTTEDPIFALAVLQQCTRKNVGGIMTEDLFSYSNTGEPKQIVKEFVEELVTSLHWLTSEAEKISLLGYDAAVDLSSLSPRPEQKLVYDEILNETVRKEKENLWKKSLIAATLDLVGSGGKKSTGAVTPPNGRNDSTDVARGPLSHYHRMEVLAFLKRARAAYGRTALCLSGGAMMGLYHIGHVLGLLEAGVLPDIISGTSGGSVIGSILCTRTDEEIRRDLNPHVLITKLKCFSRPWPERLRSLWENGNLFSFDDWMKRILWFTCGQMTFAEAYKKTGRIFCVNLTSTTEKAPPVLLNYLTTPNITIASAVVASAAVPGFVPPVRLQYKDNDGIVRELSGETYVDGSIEQDIPVAGLAEIFNCQFFIAAQCNPHIVPFFYNSKGGVGRPSRWSSGTQEASWRGGFLLAALEMYIKNDMKAKMRFLYDLEADVGFGSTIMVQDFHITGAAGTTIVPQVSFTDYFKLFSDPKLDDLYRYFQAGSVAAYEHTVMIKLHYSLVDVLDDCIHRLDHDTNTKKRRQIRPRTQIIVPESKQRVTIEIATSEHFSEGPLTPNQTDASAIFDDDDDYERSWIHNGK